MGQRLIIAIMDDSGEKELAACYYHWSGFTRASLEEVGPVIQYYLDHPNVPNNHLNAVRAFLADGKAGLCDEERYTDQAKERLGAFLFKARTGEDRNAGLIAVTDDEIQKTLGWSEGTLRVYPSSWTFDISDLTFGIPNETDNFVDALEGSEHTVPAEMYDNAIHVPTLESIEFTDLEKFGQMLDKDPCGLFFNEEWSEYFRIIE